MKYKSFVINCSEHQADTCRHKPFTVVEYTFNYSDSEDKQLIDSLFSDARELADKVFPGAANDSVHARSHKKILANCLAGVLSEYCWKHFLNYRKETVRSTPFESAANQIDLEIISNRKKIEVRSSFPRNGICFAICHPKYEFDILGPYSNNYKLGEVKKDYFIRTLFDGIKRPIEILDLIKSNSFTLYLTGGATYEMMIDRQLSKEKNFIPEDSFSITTESVYLVVPFHNALDSKEIYHLIVNEK